MSWIGCIIFGFIVAAITLLTMKKPLPIGSIAAGILLASNGQLNLLTGGIAGLLGFALCVAIVAAIHFFRNCRLNNFGRIEQGRHVKWIVASVATMFTVVVINIVIGKFIFSDWGFSVIQQFVTFPISFVVLMLYLWGIEKSTNPQR